MKKTIWMVGLFVLSAAGIQAGEIVFLDTFDYSGGLLANMNSNLVVRQAGGVTGSTYTVSYYNKTGSTDAYLQDNEATMGDVALVRIFASTNSQEVRLDLDTDFSPYTAGGQWSLSYRAKLSQNVGTYQGWTGFSVGNPADTPTGPSDGFGILFRENSGQFVVWSRGSTVYAGNVGGAFLSHIYQITAVFDDAQNTVDLTFEDETAATTNFLGTYATDFKDEIRFVELKNFVAGNEAYDGTKLVDWRVDNLTIESISGAPQPTVEESFDYSAESAFDGLAGGTGWGTNVWSAPATVSVAADSLTYPGITSVGNKMYADGTADSRSYRDMEYGFGHGTVYVSVLCQRLNETQRYFGLSLYSGSTEQMLLGQGTGFSDWTINHLATNDLDLTEAPGVEGLLPNGTLDSGILSTNLSLLLVKIDFDASSIDGSFENVTFWVNPDLSQVENIADAVGGQSYSTDRDLGTINRVRVGGGAYSETYGDPAEEYTDEIRFSTNSPFASTPTIGCSVSGGNVTFSWPSTTLGWKLQHTTNLINGTWTDVPNSETITSTNLPVSLSSEFFRLINP